MHGLKYTGSVPAECGNVLRKSFLLSENISHFAIDGIVAVSFAMPLNVEASVSCLSLDFFRDADVVAAVSSALYVHLLFSVAVLLAVVVAVFMAVWVVWPRDGFVAGSEDVSVAETGSFCVHILVVENKMPNDTRGRCGCCQ